MRKNEKIGLWSKAIWSLTLFSAIIIVFIKLLLKCFNEGLTTPEEYIIFILIGLFIIVNIKPIFKNIKKLYLYYKGENINEEKQKEIFMCEYSFMKMYQKLNLRRIFLAMILPLIFVVTFMLIILVLFFPNEIFSLNKISNSWELAISIIPKGLAIVVIVVSFFLFLKIYLGQKHNVELLFKIYDTATEEEIKILDSIQEKQYGYIFTKDFLINWDGFLNIIPLKEIKEIKYIKYFYFIIYGTRLRIKCKKKYTIWTYGPPEDEWIKRGFLSSDKKSGKSVNMDILT